MARLCTLLSWFFFCLTPVLVTVAVLAVPENAFADAGTEYCESYCKGQCGDDMTCFMNCNAACNGGWTSGCDFCSGKSGDEYTWCMAGCNAAPPPECCNSAEECSYKYPLYPCKDGKTYPTCPTCSSCCVAS